jgi:hypothetical protein
MAETENLKKKKMRIEERRKLCEEENGVAQKI